MAIAKGIIQMTGSVGNLSFYTIAGSDKVIVRTKGGASKKQIAKAPEFEKLRKHQSEWGGCVQFSQGMRKAIGELYRLADYNLSPVWTGMGKNLIKLDTEREIGARWLLTSQHKEALEGFNFNRNYPLNNVLRVFPHVEVNRENLQATVTIPRINTENDLLNIQKLPYFRLIICMGTVSDLRNYPDSSYKDYSPLVYELHGTSQSTVGAWHSANDILPEHTLTVRLDENLNSRMTNNVTLLLSIGIEFGKVGFAGEIIEVKHAGCGKIVYCR
jgi:hypothetical protein